VGMMHPHATPPINSSRQPHSRTSPVKSTYIHANKQCQPRLCATTITQLNEATHNGRDQDSGPLAWQTMMRGSVLTQHDHTSRRDSALLLHSLGTSPKPQQRQQHPAGQGVPLNTQPFANRTQGYCILIQLIACVTAGLARASTPAPTAAHIQQFRSCLTLQG